MEGIAMTPKAKEVEVTETPVSKEARIAILLEKLNALPKGERTLKGRKIRASLRKQGFYLSRQEKAETEEATTEELETEA